MEYLDSAFHYIMSFMTAMGKVEWIMLALNLTAIQVHMVMGALFIVVSVVAYRTHQKIQEITGIMRQRALLPAETLYANSMLIKRKRLLLIIAFIVAAIIASTIFMKPINPKYYQLLSTQLNAEQVSYLKDNYIHQDRPTFGFFVCEQSSYGSDLCYRYTIFFKKHIINSTRPQSVNED